MPVRADWYTTELVAADETDPFAPTDIETVGTPIVLSADGEQAELNRDLLLTIAAEAELAEQGVTCRIKDARDTSCHACPLFRADESPMARLCALGREQERLCTLLVVRRHGS